MLRRLTTAALLAALLPAQDPTVPLTETVPVVVTETKPVPIQGKRVVPPTSQRVANSIRIVNLTSHARRDVVTTVLPWKRGQYHGEPLLTERDILQASQLGASWPDGSHRYTRVHVPVELPAGGPGHPAYRDIRITTAPPLVQPTEFEWPPALLAGLRSMRTALAVGDSELVFRPSAVLESGHSVLSVKCVGRVPGTPIWAVLALSVRSGCDHVRWWLWYGASDPRDESTTWELPAVRFRVRGAAVSVWHSAAKVRGYEHAGGTTAITLDRGGRWGEGQSQMVAGRLQFLAKEATELARSTFRAESELPALAVAKTWRDSGAYGPFGVVPESPIPLDREAVVRLATEDYAKHADHPWAMNIHGLDPFPGRTGDQPPFGVTAHVVPAHGWPSILYSIQRSTYQEACRPIWFREADASIFTYANHPRIHLWYRVPFFTSPDSLGKARTITRADKRAPHGAPEWIGMDREHDVQTSEQEFALLTGDLGALLMRGALIESSLATYTTTSGNPTIDGTGAPRAIGRGLQTLAWDYLLSGREDVRRTIDARCDRVAWAWPGRTANGPLRFLGINGKDGRNLGGRTEFGFLWQDFIGVRGLAAAHSVTGNESAREVAYSCAKSLFALVKDAHGVNWNVPKAVAQPGARWTPNGWVNVGKVPPMPIEGGPPVIEYYDAYQEWIWPGVDWLGLEAERRGETALAKRCMDYRVFMLEKWTTGPAQWAKARLAKRWRLMRWGAVR